MRTSWIAASPAVRLSAAARACGAGSSKNCMERSALDLEASTTETLQPRTSQAPLPPSQRSFRGGRWPCLGADDFHFRFCGCAARGVACVWGARCLRIETCLNRHASFMVLSIHPCVCLPVSTYSPIHLFLYLRMYQYLPLPTCIYLCIIPESSEGRGGGLSRACLPALLPSFGPRPKKM